VARRHGGGKEENGDQGKLMGGTGGSCHENGNMAEPEMSGWKAGQQFKQM